MKKLFLTLLTLMVCLVANATDYYLMGVGGWNWNFDGSSQANQHKFQSNGNGTFSYTYTGTISANTGFQIAAVDIRSSSKQFRSNGNNVVLDQPYTMKFGTEGGNMSITQDVTNPTFTINPDTKILTVSTGGQIIPPTPGEISWYLQGDSPMSWENVEARELKYNESTKCYELTYTIPASTDFKFVLNSNNQKTYYRTKGNGDDNNNDEVELGADEQLYVVEKNMYTRTEMKDVKIQIYKSDSNWKVRFGASPTPGEGPAPKGNWYIWGADEKSLGNWNENQMREFMRQEDGTYKLSVYLKNNSDFQVRFKAENSSSYLNYKYGNDGGANAELRDKDDQELF